jgi:N-acetylglucosaminyldiphosphoundecaprenol N-acetyl-beta-D-mannosaminyltransferase
VHQVAGAVPTYRVAGIKFSALSADEVVDVMARWIADGHRDYIVVTGAHGVVEMQTDASLRAINEAAGVTTPDGMPVVWLGRRKGFPRLRRAYGPDIMQRAFARGVALGHRHFLYGGHPGVAEALKTAMERAHPGVQIVGTHCPPFRDLREREVLDLAREIDAARPDVVWCGLGCPKQERWMGRLRPHLAAPVLIGVGAGFDFLSGRAPQAPRWVQRSGFEWLFRLATEPRRLWPRYSRIVPRFLYLVARDELRARQGR